MILILITTIITSTLMYFYLRFKTRMNIRHLYIDNLLVIAVTSLLLYGIIFLFNLNIDTTLALLFSAISIPLVAGLGYALTMIRFWSTPKRAVKAGEHQLISPADGNILYIKKVKAHDIPISIKKGLEAKLVEITQTDLLTQPCWLVGINMTPFDVHKNCSPVNGKVKFLKHINGEFASLKHPEAVLRNERHTIVIESESGEKFGITQTASKMVRRIDSYVKEGDSIQKGDWFGMIRFGSQVDFIFPEQYNVKVQVGQQVYAVKSIIAEK